jgi:hypothetical protein
VGPIAHSTEAQARLSIAVAVPKGSLTSCRIGRKNEPAAMRDVKGRGKQGEAKEHTEAKREGGKVEGY